MKILVVSDYESPSLWDYFSKEKVRDVDLIISCGDLKAVYLEFLVTMVNKPLLYVRGNHDEHYHIQAPEGCDCIEDTLIEYHGIRIGGLGGSMRYRDGTDQYTEKEMQKRVRKLKKKIRKAGGIDILVTHAPVYGYGDMEDLPHRGFCAFEDIIQTYHPRYLLYGHVHQTYGHFLRMIEYDAHTSLINGYEYCFIEI